MPKHSLIHASSALSPTSPVLLSSSSPNPDLLSTIPFIHCEDPRQDGASTEFHSSTTTGAAYPGHKNGDYLSTFYREHNQEADHMANLGAEGVTEVAVEGFKNTAAWKASRRFLGRQQWMRHRERGSRKEKLD